MTGEGQLWGVWHPGNLCGEGEPYRNGWRLSAKVRETGTQGAPRLQALSRWGGALR